MSEIIRTGVSRRARRSGRRWSMVDHLAIISHTYGPSNELTWVRPLCGSDPGRAAVSDTGELCRRCAKLFNRMPPLAPVVHGEVPRRPQERLYDVGAPITPPEPS